MTPTGPDRKRARAAVPFLIEVFAIIGRELPDVRLHIFAHSTGAEITLNALNGLAGLNIPRPSFGELILAHADAKPSTLARIMPAINSLGLGVTSYSSAEDIAMTASRLLRWGASYRIGSRPVVQPGVDAIDISGLGIRQDLNHNVFVRNPLVFGDIARLLSTGERPPHKRTPHFKTVKSAEGRHWAYRTSD